MKTQKQGLKRHFLTVIIPAYKAQKFIQKSILHVYSVLENVGYPFEVICVVDGEVDGTYEEATKAAKKHPDAIRVVGYSNNMGKGHAVRYGMAKSKGDVVGFVDAGFDINPEGLRMLLAHFEWYDADIIVGSKRHPASKVTYPWQRKFLSFFFQVLVRILFGLKVKDTQVGMKFFKRQVLEKTLPRLLVKRWAFDVEMLAVANYLGYKRIYEAPIELRGEFGGTSVLTSKGFIKEVSGMILDTLAIFYRLKILHYYDANNRKNWITPKYLTLKKS